MKLHGNPFISSKVTQSTGTQSDAINPTTKEYTYKEITLPLKEDTQVTAELNYFE
jgi:hypothetical protein